MTGTHQPPEMNQPPRIRQDTARAEKKGQPSMSEPTASEFNQTRAAMTLVSLFQEDAPEVQWTIQTGEHSRLLDGHLLDGTDAERRRGLETWQRIIEAGPVDVQPVTRREHLHIRGSYERSLVHIVTIVDARPSCCAHCQQGHGAGAGEAA